MVKKWRHGCGLKFPFIGGDSLARKLVSYGKNENTKHYLLNIAKVQVDWLNKCIWLGPISKLFPFRRTTWNQDLFPSLVVCFLGFFWQKTCQFLKIFPEKKNGFFFSETIWSIKYISWTSANLWGKRENEFHKVPENMEKQRKMVSNPVMDPQLLLHYLQLNEN